MTSPDHKNPINQISEPGFTPEVRQKLSQSFEQFLSDNTKLKQQVYASEAENYIGIPKEDIKAELGLSILKSTLYQLIADKNFPNSNMKLSMKLFLDNLDPTGVRSTLDSLKSNNLPTDSLEKVNVESPISGLSSYKTAVNTILPKLKIILTDEIYSKVEPLIHPTFVYPFEREIEKRD